MSETRVNAILLLDEVVLAAYDESSYAKALKGVSMSFECNVLVILT
jgi:sulfur transfer complex TusBCD TusB component (DsrH family)